MLCTTKMWPLLPCGRSGEGTKKCIAFTLGAFASGCPATPIKWQPLDLSRGMPRAAARDAAAWFVPLLPITGDWRRILTSFFATWLMVGKAGEQDPVPHGRLAKDPH